MFASSAAASASKGYLFGVPQQQQAPVLPLYHQRHASYLPYPSYQAPQPSSQQPYQQHQSSVSYSGYGANCQGYCQPPPPSTTVSVSRNDYYVSEQQPQHPQIQLPPPQASVLPPSYQQPSHQQYPSQYQQAQALPQQSQPHPQPQQQDVQEQPTTGGVSSVLDYDMDQMVKFVCWLCYGLMKRNDNPSSSLHNTVKSVLSATRLPKSSLMLALLYLSDKMSKCDAPVLDDSKVFENLVIALVLANKFNDDNTFRNKSWSDATGLNVDLINQLEKKWLSEIKWRLHYEQGYSCIEECWETWCDKFNVNKSLSDVVTPELYPPTTTSPMVGYHSPSTSLFSERSQQYSPVNTPLNSSPWFDEYHQCGAPAPISFPAPISIPPPSLNTSIPAAIQLPQLPQPAPLPQPLQRHATHQPSSSSLHQLAFENSYQMQYNASMVAQQASNNNDYYSMYNQMMTQPALPKPQQLNYDNSNDNSYPMMDNNNHNFYSSTSGPAQLQSSTYHSIPPLMSTGLNNNNHLASGSMSMIGSYNNNNNNNNNNNSMNTGYNNNNINNNNSNNDYYSQQRFYSHQNSFVCAA